jgi:HEPN domain-containing protein
MRPQFAGQGVYLETSDGTWWYKHIKASVSSGQKVKAGDVIGSTAPITWVNGGPHLHLATNTGDPARARGGVAPGGGSSTAGNQPSQGEPKMTPKQRLTKLFGGGKVGAGIASRILRSGADVSEGVSGRLITDSPRGQRAIAGAGRAAAKKARKEGKKPEEVAEAQQAAERKKQGDLLRKDIIAIRKAKKLMDTRWNKLRDDLKKAKGKPKQQKALRAAMKANRKEKDDLIELEQETIAALKDLNEDIANDAYTDAYGDGGEPVEPPTEDDFLDAEAAKAALTPGLDDDLAAAQAIEAKAQRDYDAALASNDPRRISETAGALLSARQNREQIQATIANTEALNENTEAMKGMSGSTVFGYRGQDYALRSIGLPSSDTLVGMETGI